MQQMCRYGITGIFLIICSWQDIRRKELSGEVLWLFGMIAVFVDILFRTEVIMCIKGLLPGVLLLVLGKVTRQQVGYGDGLVVVIMGLLLMDRETVAILLAGLFLCAIVSMGLFFRNGLERGRGLRLPFLPFLAAGYGIQLITVIGRMAG